VSRPLRPRLRPGERRLLPRVSRITTLYQPKISVLRAAVAFCWKCDNRREMAAASFTPDAAPLRVRRGFGQVPSVAWAAFASSMRSASRSAGSRPSHASCSGASHALASDGRVWVIDPVAVERALESARELGELAGVVQLPRGSTRRRPRPSRRRSGSLVAALRPGLGPASAHTVASIGGPASQSSRDRRMRARRTARGAPITASTAKRRVAVRLFCDTSDRAASAR
jgi:hypothetical protein